MSGHVGRASCAADPSDFISSCSYGQGHHRWCRARDLLPPFTGFRHLPAHHYREIGAGPQAPCKQVVDSVFPTQTHLFIHHVLRFHLSHLQTREAVVFASHYQHLVYFAHSLEILLHAVLEDEADALPQSPQAALSRSLGGLSISTGPTVPADAVLPVVVDFLDHFAEALQVVVNCARKTEITRWAYLFQFVGKPRDLFEVSRQ